MKMPRSPLSPYYDPNLDLTPYIDQFTPEAKTVFKKSQDRLFKCKFHLFFFLLGHRNCFTSQNDNYTSYYTLLNQVWGLFTDTEINTPFCYKKTLLMNTLLETEDILNILFVIERTSPEGISTYSDQKIYSQNYALPAIIRYKYDDCIAPTIIRSGKDGLKEARVLILSKLHVPHTPAVTKKVRAYVKLIDDRLSALYYQSLPYVGKLFKTKTPAPRVIPISSSALQAQAPKAIEAPKDIDPVKNDIPVKTQTAIL